MMKILIACEYSGIARAAFEKKGHEVWSVDKKPNAKYTDRHHIGNALDYLDDGYDMLIAFPPLFDANLINAFADCNIKKIAIENIARALRQINHGRVQVLSPGAFNRHIKASALWLKDLPDITPKESQRGVVHFHSKSPEDKDEQTDRWLARRMAELWG
jgi:hypothetical protein